MSSEPPFEHPDDHTKYGPPPPGPPQPLPWMFTPGFKSSCALICVALMLTCCLSSTVTFTFAQLMHHLEAIDRHVDEIDRKLDNVTIKPKEAPKEEAKKEDALKKDDANKKEK
jgi:hypothetical protein